MARRSDRSGGEQQLVAPAIGVWASTAGLTLLAPAMAVLVGALASMLAIVAAGRLRGVSLLAIGVALGAASAAWHVRALHEGVLPPLAARHSQVELIARLVRDPVAIATAAGSHLT